MNLEEMKLATQTAWPVGKVINNPGGGTSTIMKYDESKVVYQRGASRIAVGFDQLHGAYLQFKGGAVSSTDLKAFMPSVFASDAKPAGHSCNCTFLFFLLGALGLSSKIHGSGKRGDPYWVHLAE